MYYIYNWFIDNCVSRIRLLESLHIGKYKNQLVEQNCHSDDKFKVTNIWDVVTLNIFNRRYNTDK